MTSPLKKYLAAALLLLPFAAPAAQPESHPAAQVGAQEFILRDSARPGSSSSASGMFCSTSIT